MKRLSVLLGASLLLVLSACSSPASPPVETIDAKPSATAIETPAAEAPAESGARESPLAVGEQRKLSPDSMWSLGAEGPSIVGAGYIVLPLYIGVDWEAAKAQGAAGEGVDPWGSLVIEYVTSGGRSYDFAETYVELENQLFDVGTIYEPLAEISTNYVVTLPDAEMAGGVWKVSNSRGDSVFIAPQ
jgi:hypothetical protein